MRPHCRRKAVGWPPVECQIMPVAANLPARSTSHVWPSGGVHPWPSGGPARCSPIRVGTWCTRPVASCRCTPNAAHRSFLPIASPGLPPGSRTTTAPTATPICGSSSCGIPGPARTGHPACTWSPASPAKSCSPSPAHRLRPRRAQLRPRRAGSPPSSPRRRTPRSTRAALALPEPHDDRLQAVADAAEQPADNIPLAELGQTIGASARTLAGCSTTNSA